jgi:hypothetical protein
MSEVQPEQPSPAIPERRRRNRYPLQFDLIYRAFGKGHSIVIGAARTVNISSDGVLLNATEGIQKGQLVELSIRWKTFAPNVPETNLEILGRVMRVDATGTAVRVLLYGRYPMSAAASAGAGA